MSKYIYYEGTNKEYSLERTEKHDTAYIVHANEYGEKFKTSFYAPKSYPKATLMEIGQDVASEWGAVCTNVTVHLTEQEQFEKQAKKMAKL